MDTGNRHAWLRAMGVVPWVVRDVTVGSGQTIASSPAVQTRPEAQVKAPPLAAPESCSSATPETPIAGMDWTRLAGEVAGCTRCPLCEGRTQTVFGVGNHDARVMVVGEAPGAEEDRRGEPFVGRAGGLLDNMLLAMGHPRAQVFIANIVKCRPPRNRDPEASEAAACRPFLERQISLVAPELIIAVGRVAAQRLLGTDVAVGKLRGRVHEYRGETLPSPVPLVVTYHPAYLLRSPGEKRKAWEDLKLAMRELEAVT